MIAVVALVLIAFVLFAWVTGKQIGRIFGFVVLAPISLIPVVLVAQGSGSMVVKVIGLSIATPILLALSWLLASTPRYMRDDKRDHYVAPESNAPGWAMHPQTLNLGTWPAQRGRVRATLAKLWA